MFSWKSLMKMPSRSGPRPGQEAASRQCPLGDARPFIHTIWVIHPPRTTHLHLHAACASLHFQVLLTRLWESTSNTCSSPSTRAWRSFTLSHQEPFTKRNEPNIDGPSCLYLFSKVSWLFCCLEIWALENWEHTLNEWVQDRCNFFFSFTKV